MIKRNVSFPKSLKWNSFSFVSIWKVHNTCHDGNENNTQSHFASKNGDDDSTRYHFALVMFTELNVWLDFKTVLASNLKKKIHVGQSFLYKSFNGGSEFFKYSEYCNITISYRRYDIRYQYVHYRLQCLKGTLNLPSYMNHAALKLFFIYF